MSPTMFANYNNCVSDQYSAIKSHPQSSPLTVKTQYTEYTEPQHSQKTYTCKIQANKVTQLLRPSYYEFQVTLARKDHTRDPAKFTHRYGTLQEFLLGFRCQFPYILLPYFPLDEGSLFPATPDSEKGNECIRDLQTFFENLFENGLVSPEGFLAAIGSFTPDSTRLATFERQMAETKRELNDMAPHLAQQLETYRVLNPDLSLLIRLTVRAEKLSRYFSFLLDRSYKVRAALMKMVPRDNPTEPRLDVEVKKFSSMTTMAVRFAKESRNFLDNFERGFRMVTRGKKVVAPQNGFELGARCVSEAFGYTDLIDDLRQELELDMHWTEYTGAIKADASIFPQFSEEEKKDLGLLEAQLHSFVLGMVGHLKLMLREAVDLADPQGLGRVVPLHTNAQRTEQ